MNLVVEGVEVEVHGAGGDHSQPHSVADLPSVVDLEIYSVRDFVNKHRMTQLMSQTSCRLPFLDVQHDAAMFTKFTTNMSIEKPIQNKEIMEKGL